MRSLIGVALCAVAVSALAACGGGGSTSAEQTVRGDGFVFRAPASWHVGRRDTVVSASAKSDSPQLVSVSVFRTTRPYRPSLFAKAVPELDRAARDYAHLLGGTVESGSTVRILGAPARQYAVQYEHGGDKLQERITFVLHDRTEYQLLCQWQGSDSEPDYCRQLTQSFRRT